MTTARFSALYGHWYPHKRDATAFVRALLIQVRATQAAMSAIRNVVSSARLVQTEDFGRVFSTPKLKYQAAFENHRQWLGLDLLFGRVTRHHPMYRYLVTHGISERELGEIEQQPFPPDCIGVNYYVTSDRFLDDRLARYPIGSHGSNGRDHYVDVEAVRVREEGIVGHEGVLKSAWTRYATPLALTEVHLGCTPDEQVRWLLEAWCAARAVRSAGVDVGAVTIWSLFGAYDWDSLVTTARGHYEAGAFDIRGKIPQPTALCEFAERLGQDPEFVHPLASAPGWWRSNKRFLQGEPDAAEEILSAASTRE